MPAPQVRRDYVDLDERLSQLIRLKRLERPEPDFWRSFEQEFRGKQLASLVQVQPIHVRLRRLFMLCARKAAPPTAALGVIAVSLIAVANTSYFASGPSRDTAVNTASAAPAPAPSIAHPEQTARFVVNTPDGEPAASGKDTRAAAPGSTLIHSFHALGESPMPQAGYSFELAPVTFSSSRNSVDRAPDAEEAETRGEHSGPRF